MTLLLKEVYYSLNEQEQGEEGKSSSLFLNSMRTQMRRAKTTEMLDNIASIYDEIVALAKTHDQKKQSEVVQDSHPFFKFHFRQLQRDIVSETIDDLDSLPMGEEVAEEFKRNLASMMAKRPKDFKPSIPSREEYEAGVVKVVGGDKDVPYRSRLGGT